MRVRYDPEVDILFVIVRESAPVDAVEEPGGVIVSYGDDGEPVSVEFQNASKRGLVTPGSLDVHVQALDNTGEAPA